MNRKLVVLVIVVSLAASAVLGAQEKNRLGATPVPAPIGASLSYGHTGPGVVPENTKTVDLSPWFPTPGSQGMQNSCVAWASTYAIKSYHEQAELGDSFGQGSLVFSPSFIYNQINKGRDEGSTLVDAATVLKNIGAVSLDIMPYTKDYKKQPTKDQLAQASPFRISSFAMVRPNDTAAMKAYLRKGQPVLIGMLVYENFEDYRGGVYNKTSGNVLGGHAMTILGYDDDRKAFKLINSWGTDWGEKGYAWVDYDLFARINKDALVMTDIQRMPTPQTPQTPLNVQAGKGLSQERIEVAWDSVPGAESYEVYRSLKPAADYSLVAQVKGATFIDTSVEESTLYYYAVKSVVGGNKSAYSEAAQGFLQAVPGLGVVQGLQVTWKNPQVRLSWTPVDKASGYHIYRYIPENDGFGRIGTSKDPGFADTALKDKPGTWYYMVTAFNDKKEGPNSVSVSIQVPAAPILPLVPPKGLTATQGTLRDRVELKWQPVEGAQQYVILKYDDAREAWQIQAGTKTTSWSDMKASKKETWYAVISRVGDKTSEIGDFVIGYTGTNKAPPKAKTYDDASYYSQKKDAREKGNEAWFKNDEVFVTPQAFFDSFSPQDFFFVDEAKFFAVDPDFFKSGKDFFTETDGFFN